MVYNTIIIGGGISGLTAAIYLAKAGVKPLVIKGPNPSSHVITTVDMDDLPGLMNGVNGPKLIDDLFKQAEFFGAQFKLGFVTKVDLSKRPFRVYVRDNEELQAETIIIASGASANPMDIPGEQEFYGSGVSNCATCNGFFFREKQVIVVGGGDSAMEAADYLSRYASDVLVVNRSPRLRASQVFQDRLRDHKNVQILLDRVPVEVMPGERSISGLKVLNKVTGQEEIIRADGIFTAVGKSGNTSFLEGQLATDERGYLRVKANTAQTEIAGVFACGEVQDSRYGHILTSMGTGTMAALDCERYLVSIENSK